MRYLRTATSTFENRSYEVFVHLSTLVHGVNPAVSEWRSICGYDFLSYETRTEERPVTCLWCAAGMRHSGGMRER